MEWDWERADEMFPSLLDGFWVILQITFYSALIALVLGLAIAMANRVAPKYVTVPLFWVTEFIRNTPLLVQLFFVWFGVVTLSWVEWLPGTGSAFVVGTVVLGVHYACYCSEAYRAGIDGIPKGQWEAITALSIPKHRAWQDVIIPQLFRRSTPALGNYIIAMFKEVPILFAIGVVEMIAEVRAYGGLHYTGYVEGYTIAGVIFLAASYPTAVLMRKLERRLGHG